MFSKQKKIFVYKSAVGAKNRSKEMITKDGETEMFHSGKKKKNQQKEM